ncbi:hypothetical protein Droror1_Dr00021142 [Drosera rotundifolia]
MVWCTYCLENQPPDNTKSGLICCSGCGKVVGESLQSKVRALYNNVEAKHDKREGSQYARKKGRLETKRCKGDMGFHEVVDFVDNIMQHDNHVHVKRSGKLDSVSALHDAEIASYLLSEDEKQLKTLLWERINRGYFKNQAAKKHMAASRSAKSRAEEMAAGDGAKSKKGQHREISTDRKSKGAAPKSSKKKFSSKINYDKLEEHLGVTMASDNPKKGRAGSGSNDEAMSQARLNSADKLTDFEGNEDEGNSFHNFYGGLDEEYLDDLF